MTTQFDSEDMFYGAAYDVVHEYDRIEEFVAVMMTQSDLVDHQPLQDVVVVLEGIWSEAVS